MNGKRLILLLSLCVFVSMLSSVNASSGIDAEAMDPLADFTADIFDGPMDEKEESLDKIPLETETRPGNPPGLNYFLYFFSFILVLFLAVWGSRLVARMGRMGGRYLRLVDSLYFGANRGLHLVQVAGRLFLVGYSERYLRMLTEIEDPAFLAEVQKEGKGGAFGRLPTKRKGFLDFSHYLQNFQRITPVPVEEKEVGEGLQQKLGDKLNELRDRRFGPEKDHE